MSEEDLKQDETAAAAPEDQASQPAVDQQDQQPEPQTTTDDQSAGADQSTAKSEESTKQEGDRNPVERKLDEMGLGDKTADKKPEAAAQQPGAAKPAAPVKPLTPEQEEQALLAGVTTKRGRERLEKLLGERRESVARMQAVDRVIQRSGLDREGFANVLEISRLCSSTDPEDQARGLKALETVRTELYRAMGKEAPGVDLLKDYEDLQKKVSEFGMDRKDALEIARARQLDAQMRQQASTQRVVAQQKAMLDGFGKQCMAAFSARQNDVDFNAKILAMQEYFARPGAVQNFVQTHTPETFTQALLWMYDNAGAIGGRPAAAQQPTPITQQRVRAVGKPSAPMAASADGIAARLKAMGL